MSLNKLCSSVYPRAESILKLCVLCKEIKLNRYAIARYLRISPLVYVKHRSHVKTNRVKVPTVNVFKTMTIEELASALNKPIDHIYDCLLYIDTKGNGKNSENEKSILDIEVIKEVCSKSGVRANLISKSSSDKKFEEIYADVVRRPEPDMAVCKPRPPVVTIMGHVDHGKTTLLDFLRNSNIVDQEFGGITQHIGAFSVKLKNGKSITFLDTPGHAAFSAMRGRGAKLTDIVVLVVAADDGVMPQTIESIKHAKNSQVPIVVAINKCDKADADAEACMKNLSNHGVVVEELGGDTMGVKISALKGTNVDLLQDAIIAQAELLDVKADYSGSVEGRVIESKVEHGRGKLATILVQRGTLQVGAYLVSSTASARVKAIYDEHRKQMKQAGPGLPVEVSGWKDLPSPGSEVLEVDTEAKMKAVISFRKLQEQKLKEEEDWIHIKTQRDNHEQAHQKALKVRQELAQQRYTKEVRRQIENIYAPKVISQEGSIPTLHLIIKADVDGSMEAIKFCLDTYTSDLCELDVISYGVGEITESDVELVNTCQGVIIAFNTRLNDKVKTLAEGYGITIKSHNIIYKLFDDVKEMLNAKVPVRLEQKTLGEAVVQKVFVVTEKVNNANQKVQVAGCKCVQGSMSREKQVKILRKSEVIFTGYLHSLKHFKQEVPDVKEGMECGLALKDFSVNFEEGDQIFCFDEFETKPTIDWELPF